MDGIRQVEVRTGCKKCGYPGWVIPFQFPTCIFVKVLLLFQMEIVYNTRRSKKRTLSQKWEEVKNLIFFSIGTFPDWHKIVGIPSNINYWQNDFWLSPVLLVSRYTRRLSELSWLVFFSQTGGGDSLVCRLPVPAQSVSIFYQILFLF